MTTPDLDRLYRELSQVLNPVDLEFFSQICGSGVTDGVAWVRLLNGDTLFGYSDYRETYYKDVFDKWRSVFQGLGLEPATFGAAFDAMVSYGHENCEFPQLARKSKFIKQGAVVIDVGVRAGHFLVKASRLAGPTGRVICIDATAFSEDYCRRHIAANQCDNAQFVNALVSDADEATATFYHGSSGESFSGLFRETVGGRDEKVVASAHHHGSFETTTRTIDSIAAELRLERCDLVILQINGAEVPALRGMTRTMTNFRPTIFTTCYQRPPGSEDPATAIRALASSMNYDVLFHQGTVMVLRPGESTCAQ